MGAASVFWILRRMSVRLIRGAVNNSMFAHPQGADACLATAGRLALANVDLTHIAMLTIDGFRSNSRDINR